MELADIFIIALAVLGGALPFGAIAAWRYHVQRVGELQRQLADPEAADARLAALEQTVDSLVQQMDQLASGQEFLTRMLAKQERPPLPRMEAPPPINTPH